MYFIGTFVLILCLGLAKCHFMSTLDKQQLNMVDTLKARTDYELVDPDLKNKLNGETQMSLVDKNLIGNIDYDMYKNISNVCVSTECVFNHCVDTNKPSRTYHCVMSIGLMKPTLFNPDLKRHERALNDALNQIKEYIVLDEASRKLRATNDSRAKIIEELSKYIEPLHAVRNKLDDLLVKFAVMDAKKLDHLMTTFMTTLNKLRDGQSTIEKLNSDYTDRLQNFDNSLKELTSKSNNVRDRAIDSLTDLETQHYNKIVEKLNNLSLAHEKINSFEVRMHNLIGSNDRKLDGLVVLENSHHDKVLESISSLVSIYSSNPRSDKITPAAAAAVDKSVNNKNIVELTQLERSNHNIIMNKLSELSLDLAKKSNNNNNVSKENPTKQTIDELLQLENKNHNTLLGKLNSIEEMYENSRYANAVQIKSNVQPIDHDSITFKDLVAKEAENHNIIISRIASLQASFEKFIDYYSALNINNNNNSAIENKSLLLRSIENGMLYFYIALVAIKGFLVLCVYNLRKCLKRIFCCYYCRNDERKKRLNRKNCYKDVYYSKEDIQL